MIVFPCHVCHTSLSAEDAQAGQLVRCPTCMTTLNVPRQNAAATPATVAAASGARETAGEAAGGGVSTNGGYIPPPSPMTMGAGRAVGGRRYGFNCGYCSSRLEATEGMAGQDGQCPTCGNSIVIPILDRYGRLIDPMTGKIIKQDPHPVHAYAAAGDRAPQILKNAQGERVIKCPKCSSLSPVSVNNCKACGMPFTMEGTTLEATGTSNGFCVASLVLGIISIPAFCTVITPILAVIFGIIGLVQTAQAGETGGGGGRGMAIAGIICGVIAGIIFMMTII